MAFDTSGIRLKPCVDLFSTEASRQDASLEKIREIPLDQLVPFKDHPFKVIDDESMMDTVQSIREHGIRNIKNYLIATLMNTPITQESQFTAEYRAHPV